MSAWKILWLTKKKKKMDQINRFQIKQLSKGRTRTYPCLVYTKTNVIFVRKGDTGRTFALL